MASTLVPRIQGLIKDYDPGNRLLGLMQAEASLPVILKERAEPSIAALIKDASPPVASYARRVVDKLEQASGAQRAAVSSRPFLAGISKNDLAGLGSLKEMPSDRLQSKLIEVFGKWLSLLHEHLAEQGPAASVRAVEAIGRLGWTESVVPLVTAARYQRLQAPCVEALAWMSTGEAQRALVSLTEKSSGPARVMALEALGSCNLVDPLPVLTAALEATPDERRAACRALGRLGVARGWRLLYRTLNDTDREVAIEAVRALARIGDEAFAPTIAALAASDQPRIRATVASALGHVYSQEIREAVVTLARDKDARVRANAIQAAVCYHLDHHRARKFYFDLLRDPHHRVKAGAVVGLWSFNQDAAAQVLKTLIASENPVERATAYWCVGQLDEKGAADLLIDALLKEQDPKAIEQALQALDSLRRSEVFEPVRRLILVPWPKIRTRACAVLARVGQMAALPTLIQMLRWEKDPKVRSCALRSVARLSPPDGLSLLPDGNDPESDRIASNVVEGLAESGQASASHYIKRLLVHRSARVRSTAAVALVGLGDLSALETLEGLWPSAPATAFWTLKSIGELLTPRGVKAHPFLATALAS
ncbi:MAG: HEAT repeat domain-containing protein [Candidatus Riflebacteria bacterium]|nr:HEAT repeat domain-containing protein [Candidatus Riflebacteria bacterium]